MRKLFYLLAIFVVLFSNDTSAQLLLLEDFDYPEGDTIGNYGWVTFSGTSNPLTVTSPGLMYTGYPSSGVGNAVTLMNTGFDAYKSLTVGDSIGSVYTSFMVNVDTAKSGDYFIAYLSSTSTSNYAARVFAKDSLGMLSFGLRKSSQGDVVYSEPIYSYDVTYLLVLKYTFNTSSDTDDDMSLFVFTDPVLPPVEPIPTIGPITGTQSDLNNISRIALRQGSSSNAATLIVDGIRISESWTGVLTSINSVSQNANSFLLSKSYPNPFNPNATIEFSLPSNGFVKLKIFNSLGQEIEQLLNNNFVQGIHKVTFNAAGLNSGIYYYKIEFTSNKGDIYTDIRKIVLIK